MKYVELAPIEEDESDYDAIEKRILSLLVEILYRPLLKILDEPVSVIKNSANPLEDALSSGRVTFYRGHFKGNFNSSVSRELKSLGAVWDRTQGSWKVPLSKLPTTIRSAIARSEEKFSRILQSIDNKLVDTKFQEIDLSNNFDKTLWKVERKLQKQLSAISVKPQLTEEEAAKVSSEYSLNMNRYIKDFTEAEIIKLRERVKEHVNTGNRYEDLMKVIQRSYGVSKNKAKFLARQETSLMMAAFKEARYVSAGSQEYKWICVHGSKDHPVRPMHERLNGTIQKWSNPPITDEKGNRNNPGQDYNCRCVARAIVKFS